MKTTKIYIVALFTSILSPALSQTYVQGINVVPNETVFNSPVLSGAKKLTIEEAFSKLVSINHGLNNGFSTIYTSKEKISGQFYEKDNLVIQLVTRKLSDPSVDLNEIKEITYGMYTDYLGEGENPFEADYFDELKQVNNFQTLVYYRKSSNKKNFSIISNDKKYSVQGVIHCYPNDKPKAQAFINTLLNSITFK